MARDTLGPRGPRASLRWQGIATGAALALVLSFGLGALAALTGSIAVAATLAALGYALAGAGAVLLRSAARPAEPAVGAAVSAALIGGLQLASLARAPERPTTGGAALSLSLSIALAAALAWFGARLAAARPPRRAGPPTLRLDAPGGTVRPGGERP